MEFGTGGCPLPLNLRYESSLRVVCEDSMKRFFFGGGKSDEEKVPPPPGAGTVYLTGDERVDAARVQLLLDTMAEVISSVDPDLLLVQIVDRCIRLVGAERGILFLKDSTGAPAIKVARDAEGRDIEGSVQFTTKSVNEVFEKGRPVLLKVGSTENEDLSQSIVDLKIRAVMCVTLSVKSEIIGVIYVDSRATSREFRQSDLKFFDALANAMAITIENARLVSEYVKKERLEESLEIARRIQTDLLPENPVGIKGFDIAGRVEALEETAGDYYDFIPIGEDRIGLVVGDVKGHGVGPAILMSSVRSLIRAQVCREFTIDSVLAFLNNQLEQDTDEDNFVSLFVGILDLKQNKLVYGNAGHCPPLHFRRSTGRFEELKRTGMALGIVSDTEYTRPETIDLEPGDLLALYTDGILEAKRRSGELFGLSRFKNLLKEWGDLSSAQLIEKVFRSVREYIGNEGAGDDLTLSVVKAT